ncbi:MAG: hypothetical protein JO257_12430 [Deltaproteobacteria bacterium]|nr:hypothetical protein [Deltaproteobacteria bacterium]
MTPRAFGESLAPGAFGESLTPGALVMFGELHGTLEAPAFVADVAAAVRGPVTLALELPDDVQPGVDACLATGSGLVHDVPFWQWRDGRGGRGLVALLDVARRLGARVVCFDGTFDSGEARDAGMAANLISAVRPTDVTLALCGNLHARIDDPRWMGWHVRERVPGMLSLDLGYDGGAAWCATDAGVGVHELRARHDGPRGVELAPCDGYDGVYRVGVLTPSEPLR